MLPMNKFFHVYKFIQENEWDMPEPMEERMEQFVELDEIRNDAHKRNMKFQQRSDVYLTKGLHKENLR